MTEAHWLVKLELSTKINDPAFNHNLYHGDGVIFEKHIFPTKSEADMYVGKLVNMMKAMGYHNTCMVNRDDCTIDENDTATRFAGRFENEDNYLSVSGVYVQAQNN